MVENNKLCFVFTVASITFTSTTFYCQLSFQMSLWLPISLVLSLLSGVTTWASSGPVNTDSYTETGHQTAEVDVSGSKHWDLLTQRWGTRLLRFRCLGANMCSCCRQAMASACTKESGCACITAQQTRQYRRAVPTALEFPVDADITFCIHMIMSLLRMEWTTCTGSSCQ